MVETHRKKSDSNFRVVPQQWNFKSELVNKRKKFPDSITAEYLPEYAIPYLKQDVTNSVKIMNENQQNDFLSIFAECPRVKVTDNGLVKVYCGRKLVSERKLNANADCAETKTLNSVVYSKKMSKFSSASPSLDSVSTTDELHENIGRSPVSLPCGSLSPMLNAANLMSLDELFDKSSQSKKEDNVIVKSSLWTPIKGISHKLKRSHMKMIAEENGHSTLSHSRNLSCFPNTSSYVDMNDEREDKIKKPKIKPDDD